MTNIIFVKQFKYPNKCATCKQTIPKGTSGFWDKDNKGINYHDNGKCYDANPKPKGDTSIVEISEAMSVNKVLSSLLPKHETGSEILERCKELVLKAFPDATAEAQANLTATLIDYERASHWFEMKI